MSKFRKSILIIGILVVMVAASLGTAFALLATGTIKTDPVELIYSVHDAEKIYDGTPLTASEYRLTKGELLPGHTAQVEFLGSQTAVGTSQSDLSVKIYDAKGYNVTSGYVIKVINGELTVGKKAVKVTMPSQKVVYNGSKVLFEEYSVADPASSLVSGHKIYGSTEAKLMNVGDTLPEDLKPLVFDVAGNEVTDNYDIDFEIGEIEVIPRPVSVRPVSFEKVYDGRAIFADEFEFIEGSLVEGQWAEFEINRGYDYSLLDAGELETSVTSFKIYETVNGEAVEVTGNYDVSTYETGTLKVTPRPLTVYAPDRSWIYDGAEHDLQDENTVRSEGLADTDEILAVTFSGSITDVGKGVSGINTVTLSCSEKNYSATFVDGVLEVTPYELTVTTADAEKLYDGAELFDTAITLSTPYGVNALANATHGIDKALNAEYPAITQVGSVTNGYECRIFAENGVSVTENYAITYKYGTLTVNKMPVAITLGVEEIEYDGKSHDPDLSEGGGCMKLEAADGSELGITPADFEPVSSSRLMQDAKEYSYTVRFADKSNYANYDLEIKNTGYLKINERKLTVGTLSKTRSYNGQPLTHGEYELADGTSLADGHTASVPAVLPSITDFGTLTNQFAVTVCDGSGADVTKNYVITYSYGTLEITACAVDVQLLAFEHTFNNRAYQVKAEDAVKITLSGTAGDGEGISAEDILSPKDFTISYTEEIIHVKMVENMVAFYGYTAEITDKRFAKNFSVNVINTDGCGKVKVLPREVTATVKDVRITYNGEDYVLDSYTAISAISDTTTGLSRDDFKVQFTDGAATHSEYVKDGYTYSVSINEDKATDYKLKVQNFENITKSTARLFVNKYRVTITSGTESKVYNGRAQKCLDFTNTPLVRSDHKIFITNENNIALQNAGSKDNAQEYKICTVKSDGITELKNVTNNYEIVKVCGKLTVTKRPVTLTTESVNILYDGVTKAESSAVTANEGALVAGHTVKWDNVGTLPSLIGAGKTDNVFACKITDEADMPVTDNYQITYVYGTLNVEKRKITLQTGSVSKYYDAEKAEDKAVTAVVGEDGAPVSDGFAAGHSAKIAETSVAPSLLNAGKADNVFDYVICDADGKDVTANYECETVWGVLEVKPFEIELKLNDFTGETDDTGRSVRKALTYSGSVQALTLKYAIKETAVKDVATLTKLSGEIAYEIDYFGNQLLNAGDYEYTVKFADSVNTDNFKLTVGKAKVLVKKMVISLGLTDLSFTFDNTEKVLKPSDKYDDSYVLNAVRHGADDIFNNDVEEGAYGYNPLLVRSDFEIVTDEPIYLVRYAEDADGVEKISHYTYSARFANAEKAANFQIDGNPTGKITVNPLKLEMTMKDYAFNYNGEKFNVDIEDAVRITNTVIVKVKDFKVNTSAEIKNVKDLITVGGAEQRGFYKYTVAFVDADFGKNFILPTVKVLDADGNPTSETEPKYGKVTVNPLDVKVHLRKYAQTYNDKDFLLIGSDAFIADSALLTADKLTFKMYSVKEDKITVDGVTTVKKEYISVKKIRDAGKYVYTVQLTNDDDSDNVNVDLNNFKLLPLNDEIEIKDGVVWGGEITIHQYEIKLSMNNLSYIYDGNECNWKLNKKKAIANRLDTEIDSGFFSIEDISLRYKENQKDENGNLITSYLGVGVYEYEAYVDEAKANNFKIIHDKATVTVLPREITISTFGESKIFDGDILKNDTPAVTDGSLVEGHELSYDKALAPEISEVGSMLNEFEIKIVNKGVSVIDNYKVTWDYGTLEITPRPVTVKTASLNEIYDGREFSDGKVEIDGLDGLTGYNVKPVDASAVPVISNAGSKLNEFLCFIYIGGTDEEGYDTEIDVSSNFVIEYEYGTLTVEPRKAVVRYDCEAKEIYSASVISLDVTADSLSLSAEVEFDEIKETEVTRAQLEAILLGSLTVDFNSIAVRNAGVYNFKIKFADEADASNFDLTFTDVGGAACDGSGRLTVERFDVEFEVTAPVEKPYNGAVQSVPLTYVDDFGNERHTLQITSTISGAMSAELSSDSFKIVYPEAMLNAKEYKFNVEFKDTAMYQNYRIMDASKSYTITRLEIGVSLDDTLKLIYNGKDQTSAVKSAIRVTGEGAKFLGVNDFNVTSDKQIIAADTYTCRIAFANRATALNFYVNNAGVSVDAENVESFDFDGIEVAKRKVALKLNTVHVSAVEWAAQGIGEYGEYSVKDELCIDPAYSLGDGDKFIVESAIGFGDGNGNIEISPSNLPVYKIADANGDDASGNYEIINEGMSLSARLIGPSA